ncbi:MAG: (d)CMP kinase [Pseudomonadota bacterium]
MTNNVPVLTIDGPSGSGKGTVGQILAQRLGWHFLDSGALYRALGVAAEQAAVSFEDRPALARLARSMDIRFIPRADGAPAAVLLHGAEIGDRLRTEDSGRLASIVAAIPEVRQALLQKQHSFRQPPGLVADGRDMGSTVFPDAILKVFLTASPEVRAERRHKQLMEKGFDVNLPRLLDEIRERDARDAGRAVSPLKPAEDACILDTSQLDISGVVERVHGLLRERHRPG